MTGSIWVAGRGRNYDWSRASDPGIKISLRENTNADKWFVVQFGLTFRVAKGSISLTFPGYFVNVRLTNVPFSASQRVLLVNEFLAQLVL